MGDNLKTEMLRFHGICYCTTAAKRTMEKLCVYIPYTTLAVVQVRYRSSFQCNMTNPLIVWLGLRLDKQCVYQTYCTGPHPISITYYIVRSQQTTQHCKTKIVSHNFMHHSFFQCIYILFSYDKKTQYKPSNEWIKHFLKRR